MSWFKKAQKVQGGENSVNLQAGRDIHIGISAVEAFKIAEYVFQNNITKFTDIARTTSDKRAKEVSQQFFEKIQKEQPENFKKLEEPAMQNALFNMQKAYALSGDINKKNLLVDILARRTKESEQSLTQIVLDESLEIIPKLTLLQIDALTLVFIIKQMNFNHVTDMKTFTAFTHQFIEPFLHNIPTTRTFYLHLQYLGCAEIGMRGGDAITVFGNTIEEFWLNKFQTIFLDQLSINSTEQLKEYLLSNIAIAKQLFNIWDNSQLGVLTLSTVGMAIAHANFVNKTKQDFPLDF
jgi:hypothetical protein